jgi:iron complex transport system substrate-binding protein
MLALVEIAVVLCSLFFVATLPGIAADQNQEMQKASASEVTKASEDDYVLGVYGNANEDDTIDMRDLTYVKLIFFGKKPETVLADAKYDGKINPLDFIQIKLIIVGKEKELTLIDSADRIVTVKKPLKRIVVTYTFILERLRLIGVEETQIIGVEYQVILGDFPHYRIFFPEYQDKPGVTTEDPESIITLDPDVVIMSPSGKSDPAANACEAAGITVIRFYGGVWGKEIVKEVKKLGYIFDKQKAEEFLDFYEGLLNSIKEMVEKIPEEDKPKVYFEVSKPYTSYSQYAFIEKAGGTNILPDAYGSVDPEAVIDRDPDIIVVVPWGWKERISGYTMDAGDTAGLKKVRDEVMSRPELQNVKAVKNGRVYVLSGHLITFGPTGGSTDFLQIAYMAKWFHPELFEDLDPKAIHQEYLTRFQGLDFDLNKHGVFVYPPLES